MKEVRSPDDLQRLTHVAVVINLPHQTSFGMMENVDDGVKYFIDCFGTEALE